jgi:hypothetical protein
MVGKLVEKLVCSDCANSATDFCVHEGGRTHIGTQARDAETTLPNTLVLASLYK